MESNYMMCESFTLELDELVAIKNLFFSKNVEHYVKNTFLHKVFLYGYETYKEVTLFQIYTHNTPTVTFVNIQRNRSILIG